jgi:hypothetical protein
MITKKKNSRKPRVENAGPWNTPLDGIFATSGFNNNQQQMSLPFEMQGAESYYLISLNRIVLTYAYTLFGPLKTLVDAPVNDAFRKGIKIKSDMLSPEDIEALNKRIKKTKLVRALKQAMKWDRLFGGAGIIINANDDDMKTPFNIKAIDDKSKLEFIVGDRWELAWNGIPEDPKATFLFYSKTINQSRVLKVVGDEAPSLARQRLQGWRMSILERVVREYNAYLKHQNVSWELMDEAKVDVYKVKGFNANILQKGAQAKTAQRIEIANRLKNFLNALILDMEDDYVTKTQSFSGMADMQQQNHTAMAAAIGFPQSKIWGFAAKGWDAGESDLENYNSIVEGVREEIEDPAIALVSILCQAEFGFVPEDLKVEWHPLRVLSAEQEETVKDAKFNRLTQLRSSGHLNPEEYMAALKEENIFTMETEVGKGLVDPEENRAMVGEDVDGEEDPAASGGKKGKTKPEKPEKPDE